MSSKWCFNLHLGLPSSVSILTASIYHLCLCKLSKQLLCDMQLDIFALTVPTILQGYVKGPIGRNGLGPLSVGLIFDKALDF